MPSVRPVIEAILFDKDGTLIDFRQSWMPAYKAVALELGRLAGGGSALADLLLRRQGYEPTTDTFTDQSPLLWDTNEAIAARWAAMPELAAVPDVSARTLAHLADEVIYPPVPVGDVAALFSRLRERGLKLGIATMDDEAKARHLAACHDLAPHLELIIGCDSGHGIKPEPGMVEAFCRVVGVPPARTLMVGDTHADLQMGRRAGCGMVVGVRTGGTPLAVLEAGADIVLSSVMEIESIL
ncbi:phosphoglycolate phosphatase [Arboricoccus pini]|uniref:phosphoglycolate phosphatase n=1 Tax=Arboricoccus pini TaxID=1963835 RepID=A0A212RIM8_9PROT|nr:HAD family hydrolase [Arboricoccus pini]SNB72244.1 phosphoglycolate phosphatase [Arboricoccus pini]